MTSKQLYHAVQIELNKENAPNILLESFNYFVNRAINQYVNKRYNIYDINQQTTDDLRVLKATAILEPTKSEDYNDFSTASMATYYVTLPSDYLHMLNCICIYKVKKTWNCYDAGDHWRAPAKRLTADAFSQVLDNFWNKPTHNKPYYYIHNVNKVDEGGYTKKYIPTGENDGILSPLTTSDSNKVIAIENGFVTKASHIIDIGNNTILKCLVEYNIEDEIPIEDILNSTFTQDGALFTSTVNDKIQFSIDSHTQANGITKDIINVNNLYPPTTIGDLGEDSHGNPIAEANLNNTFIKINKEEKISNVERGASIRYGNSSEVRCEIRYGSDDRIFELEKVYIDYIKVPQHIRLTVKQLDSTEDISQVLEYPDYVCQEILNELVHIIMENISDQRLQTHPVVSQSIANPAQQQTETVAQPQ